MKQKNILRISKKIFALMPNRFKFGNLQNNQKISYGEE
jgi:hypothetical protein